MVEYANDLEGQVYFNQPKSITLPMFEKIEWRGGIVKTGKIFEIDLTAQTADDAVWLVQIRYTKVPMGIKEVEKFISQTDLVIQKEGYTDVTRWYFCKQGYTVKARQALEQAGILSSDLPQFNGVAKMFKFFGLPKGE
ncbi:hypothetical protein QUF64_15225 [Anaerolineales bacterium HSG6]|nr:hypothetical protein [Anaerolineales bacterium HSG6]MDM8531925.1 hypothetical protein [Anaerolineales bacterium HSG25]